MCSNIKKKISIFLLMFTWMLYVQASEESWKTWSDFCLEDIIMKSYKPLQNHNSKFVYPHLKTSEDVIAAIRKLNDGFLPIPVDAKTEIVDMLFEEHVEKYPYPSDLDAFAVTFQLHPISVDKIKKMLHEKIQAADKIGHYICSYVKQKSRKADQEITELDYRPSKKRRL